MKPVSIELQRARRRLETFCTERNRALRSGPRWRVSEVNNQFDIYRAAAPVVRLYYDEGGWHVLVPRADGGWMDYPPRPRLAGIDAVIGELDQAPLHVHW